MRARLASTVGAACVIAACGGSKAYTETVTEIGAPKDEATKVPETLDSGVAPIVDAGRIDSGACPPASIDESKILAMHGPRQHAGMCASATQLQEGVARCVQGVGSCSEWLKESRNVECQECLFSTSTDTTWGPVVYLDKRSFYNRGGAAALSGASPTCVAALSRVDICVQIACSCGGSGCSAKASAGPCKALSTARDVACVNDKALVAGLDTTQAPFFAMFCPP